MLTTVLHSCRYPFCCPPQAPQADDAPVCVELVAHSYGEVNSAAPSQRLSLETFGIVPDAQYDYHLCSQRFCDQRAVNAHCKFVHNMFADGCVQADFGSTAVDVITHTTDTQPDAYAVSGSSPCQADVSTQADIRPRSVDVVTHSEHTTVDAFRLDADDDELFISGKIRRSSFVSEVTPRSSRQAGKVILGTYVRDQRTHSGEHVSVSQSTA